MANGRINISILRQEIARQQVLDAAAAQLVKQRFAEEKARMIDDISNDTVSQEIEAGAYASDTSGLVSSSTGANLFSFLGFREGSEPIQELKDFLDSHITVNAIPVKNGLSWRFTGRVPTQDEIYKATPVHWPESNRSWVRAIEKGITDSAGSFKYYLFKNWKDISRAGIGLQAKNIKTGAPQIVRNRDSRTRQYVSKYLNKFVNTISTSGRQ